MARGCDIFGLDAAPERPEPASVAQGPGLRCVPSVQSAAGGLASFLDSRTPHPAADGADAARHS